MNECGYVRNGTEEHLWRRRRLRLGCGPRRVAPGIRVCWKKKNPLGVGEIGENEWSACDAGVR